jgi:hypothetical protein
MTQRPSNGGRRVLISLSDVPLKIRKRHAVGLLRAAADNYDLDGLIEITRAVEFPSAELYEVSEENVLRVLGRVP